MIAFCFLGLIVLYKKNRRIAYSVFTFIIVNVYVISSWGTWWQGGSFGSRYFLESYAILALPLGYLIVYINEKKILKYFFYPVASFFLFLNLFQTWQFNNFIFDGYTMTKEYYWKTFLKTSVAPEDRKFREVVRDFLPVDVLSNPHDYEPVSYTHLTLPTIYSV